ncbi:uncharacterized protein BKA78DRAFT_110299 [Phyllosticta capitalensis]|uniref:uncharacterized protein n=1 Tax=Phyllosticta capitalensis TaxID=121624 RepID=UPI0031305615
MGVQWVKLALRGMGKDGTGRVVGCVDHDTTCRTTVQPTRQQRGSLLAKRDICPKSRTCSEGAVGREAGKVGYDIRRDGKLRRGCGLRLSTRRRLLDAGQSSVTQMSRNRVSRRALGLTRDKEHRKAGLAVVRVEMKEKVHVGTDVTVVGIEAYLASLFPVDLDASL